MGGLLCVHPFRDFNGRVTRVFLRELLRRLHLPALFLAPTESVARSLYLVALHAADASDYRPLMEIWKQRIASSSLDFHP